MNFNPKYASLVLKGMAMGAADVIPGVSGGTIAFITGIYEELLGSIKSVDLSALKLLTQFKFKEFWRHINGKFLLSVVGGIAISIFSLAKLMKYLLDSFPIFVWSFFFGLILASTLMVGRTIKKWNVGAMLALVAGAAAAYSITVVTPASTPEAWWFIIISGAIAICAMILPGISGAFILLLLGKYEYIIAAVSELRVGILALFVVGAVTGIVAFSHVLSWLLKKYHTATIALLTGFMVGSLNKIWPWKETLSTFVDRHGVEKVLIEKNILPTTFEQLTGQTAYLGWSIVFIVLGFSLIFGLEKIAGLISQNKEKK